MYSFVFILLDLTIFSLPAFCQLSNPTLWTSYVPLAIRSPYFSAWMNTTNGAVADERAPGLWPCFWSKHVFGWVGYLRVDNSTTYKWLGDIGHEPGGPPPVNNTVITNIQITPTRTVMNVTAGPINLTIAYLSPIEPSDPALQSLPLSYYYVMAVSNDAQSHQVQIYTDTTGEWLSGDSSLLNNWQTQNTGTTLYHKVFLATPRAFTEKQNQIEDASLYLATLLDPETTYQTDYGAKSRTQFIDHGSLTGSTTMGPIPINQNFTVHSISKDFGNVGSSPTDPVVWAIGMLRDPATQFTTSSGAVEQRSAYWRTKYANDQSDSNMVTAFLQDFSHAVQRADGLDQALGKNASSLSSHYSDLVALAARQTIAATEVTVGNGARGEFDISDVKMFMKDVGSSGRVNPVEVMYSSFPFFLSLNASYGGWLLSPVLEFASSNYWSHPYAPRDIGLNYPNATGNSASHSQGVEQSGNMLIMALAHARASGDGSLLSQYYPLMKTWADYLVNNTSPLSAGQMDADNLTIRNSTNLAIKGIIAIKAMAQISAALQHNSDADHYSNLADAYASTWLSSALPSGSQQILLSYGAPPDSYTLPYNLFADKWLGTDLIGDETYGTETTFIRDQLDLNTNGIPVNSQSNSNGNTAWTLFTAATMSDTNVRNTMVDQVWSFISKNTSGSIFPTSFSLDGQGRAMDNTASPGVGGIFAPLALTIPNTTIMARSAPPVGGKKNSDVGRIAGGVIGGVCGAALLALIAFKFLLWQRSRRGRYDAARLDYFTPRSFMGAPQRNHVRKGSRRAAPSPHLERSANMELAELSAEVESMRRAMRDLQEDRTPPPTYRE